VLQPGQSPLSAALAYDLVYAIKQYRKNHMFVHRTLFHRPSVRPPSVGLAHLFAGLAHLFASEHSANSMALIQFNSAVAAHSAMRCAVQSADPARQHSAVSRHTCSSVSARCRSTRPMRRTVPIARPSAKLPVNARQYREQCYQ
jgi:hypothetical protein